jgi:hypothetical protein
MSGRDSAATVNRLPDTDVALEALEARPSQKTRGLTVSEPGVGFMAESAKRRA